MLGLTRDVSPQHGGDGQASFRLIIFKDATEGSLRGAQRLGRRRSQNEIFQKRNLVGGMSMYIGNASLTAFKACTYSFRCDPTIVLAFFTP